MEIIVYKEIPPQFASKRPVNLYKEWSFVQSDISPFLSAISWENYVTASVEAGSSSIYNKPTFPTLNAKYARFYAYESSSREYQDLDDEDDDGYYVNFNHTLQNGDVYNKRYLENEVYKNPDGTSAYIVYKSLNTLFYSGNAVYKEKVKYVPNYKISYYIDDVLMEYYTPNNPTSILESIPYSGSYTTYYCTLKNEAFVFEIPRRYVADNIEPNTFSLTDVSNIYNLPYTDTGSNAYSPFDNTPVSNSEAIAGVNLYDNGNGCIFDSNYSSSVQRGHIFYSLGLVVITDEIYAKYFKEYITDYHIASGSL